MASRAPTGFPSVSASPVPLSPCDIALRRRLKSSGLTIKGLRPRAWCICGSVQLDSEAAFERVSFISSGGHAGQMRSLSISHDDGYILSTADEVCRSYTDGAAALLLLHVLRPCWFCCGSLAATAAAAWLPCYLYRGYRFMSCCCN